jgi:putative ABC transport system permease protein
MKLLLKLAWRNIWRNKRRSLITIAAVFFAVLLSIGMRGLQLGTYEVNIATAVRLFSGFLQIQKIGYQDNPSLRKSFTLSSDITQLLDNDAAVTGYAPRINADGLISYKDNSLGTAIFGIIPQKERNVTNFMKKINVGEFFQTDTTNKVVLGYKLLENLKAEVGDKIVILAQGYDGILGNMIFEICGTTKTGSGEFDRTSVFMGLSKLQELLAMEGRLNAIAISTKNLDQVTGVKNRLNHSLKDDDLVALSWDEVMPELKQIIQLDNVSGLLMLAILVIVVAFGILNTVLMSVTERFREFGISLAMGMPQMTLVFLVIIESVIITLFGLILGDLAAYGVNYYIAHNPIVFGGALGALYEEYGFLPLMKSSVKLSIFFNNSITIFVVSLISIIYPAIKVFRLEPLKGIRYT